jgi:hypothetical protein
MKKTWIMIGLLAAHVCYGADFSATAQTGYKGGLGFKVSAAITHFAQGFPLGFEFGIGHTRLDPGSPELARKVFINEATNGTPEKVGFLWDLRFDFLIPVRVMGMQDAYLFLGVRRAYFTASFKYVGGNEAFDITSDPWGWGGGLKANFPMGRSISFTLTAGLDYFPNSGLTGHDTTYYPDGEIVNQERNYTYQDADDAVNQPKVQPVLLIGVTLGL